LGAALIKSLVGSGYPRKLDVAAPAGVSAFGLLVDMVTDSQWTSIRLTLTVYAMQQFFGHYFHHLIVTQRGVASSGRVPRDAIARLEGAKTK
jgi:hypothetical protein